MQRYSRVNVEVVGVRSQRENSDRFDGPRGADSDAARVLCDEASVKRHAHLSGLVRHGRRHVLAAALITVESGEDEAEQLGTQRRRRRHAVIAAGGAPEQLLERLSARDAHAASAAVTPKARLELKPSRRTCKRGTGCCSRPLREEHWPIDSVATPTRDTLGDLVDGTGRSRYASSRRRRRRSCCSSRLVLLPFRCETLLLLLLLWFFRHSGTWRRRT
jgi:hypothetical protein